MDTFFARLALSNDRTYRIGRHFLFWFVCWAFMGFIYGFMFIAENQSEYIALSYFEAILYLPQHILLSYGLMYFILPEYITREKYWSAIVATLVLIFVVAFMSPLIVRFVINPIRESLSIAPKSEHGIFFSLMAGLRGSMTVAGFAVAIKLIKLWYQKKTDNERLEKENLRAELEILKGQLHPHFMFNTLNSIYSLALKKSDHTAEAIIKLSNLMRFILTECNSSTIELQKEIEVLSNYIELEKARFGKRLDISINVSGDVQQTEVPPLLLIPFLENSFKHGANEMTDLAWISLDLHVALPLLTFKLINGKPAENPKAKDSFLVGLVNVQRRLQLLYPNGHELRITEDPDTFVVVLVIQLDKLRLPDAS
jgi:sensor histidine kinase YesM